MGSKTLYPLRFEPVYQYRLWGDRRLSGLLSAPLPGDGPVGEAWVLSDRNDHQSQVANGPLKGQTIGLLMGQYCEQVMGKLASRFHRFPLLLKFLDSCEMLSVQVHPSGIHQGRLPQELRLRGIRTLEAANDFLNKHYIAEFNRRFAMPAAQHETAFISCRAPQ